MLNISDFARLGPVSPRMLRHYDQTGLLTPDHVDPVNGYRVYSTAQLPRLHRILALRDLGFGIDEIAGVLHDEPSIEELRAMLRLRRSQVEATLVEQTDRLRRIEAQLQAIERDHAMTMQDIVIKETPALRVLETTEPTDGYGYEHIGPVYPIAVPRVMTELQKQHVRPQYCVGYYETANDEGAVTCHIGFAVGNDPFTDTDDVREVVLPSETVASFMHRGNFAEISSTYESLFRWIEDSGYVPNGLCRELYLQWDPTDETNSVTELQVPIRSATA